MRVPIPEAIRPTGAIVDLGPDGGEAGGHILFAGTPEEVAEQDSHTGEFLAAELARVRAAEEDDEEVDLDAMADDGDDSGDSGAEVEIAEEAG